MDVEQVLWPSRNCNDINEITKKDDVFKEWRIFVNKFLSKVFPSIYYENDNKFHCDKSPCIIELIKIIDSLDIDDEFKITAINDATNKLTELESALEKLNKEVNGKQRRVHVIDFEKVIL